LHSSELELQSVPITATVVAICLSRPQARLLGPISRTNSSDVTPVTHSHHSSSHPSILRSIITVKLKVAPIPQEERLEWWTTGDLETWSGLEATLLHTLHQFKVCKLVTYCTGLVCLLQSVAGLLASWLRGREFRSLT
jgi:hypothetical protein